MFSALMPWLGFPRDVEHFGFGVSRGGGCKLPVEQEDALGRPRSAQAELQSYNIRLKITSMELCQSSHSTFSATILMLCVTHRAESHHLPHPISSGSS